MSRVPRISYLLLAILFLLASCSITTTYGVGPQLRDPSEPDIYTVKVYYNAFSSQDDIDRKAREEFTSLAKEKGYASFEALGRECSGSLDVASCTYVARLVRSSGTTADSP